MRTCHEARTLAHAAVTVPRKFYRVPAADAFMGKPSTRPPSLSTPPPSGPSALPIGGLRPPTLVDTSSTFAFTKPSLGFLVPSSRPAVARDSPAMPHPAFDMAAVSPRPSSGQQEAPEHTISIASLPAASSSAPTVSATTSRFTLLLWFCSYGFGSQRSSEPKL